MMRLISRVVVENIGLIDWEPHLSLIFTWIQKNFDLPMKFLTVKASEWDLSFTWLFWSIQLKILIEHSVKYSKIIYFSNFSTSDHWPTTLHLYLSNIKGEQIDKILKSGKINFSLS